MASAEPDLYRQAYQKMFSAAKPIRALSLAYEAEKAVSVLLGGVYPLGEGDRRPWLTGFVDGFAKYLGRRRNPESGAVLAGLASVAPGVGGERAAKAVRRFSQADVQLPLWAGHTGKVHCTGAWQVRDLYGDQTHYIATFGYDSPASGGPEHAVCALLDHNRRLVVDLVVACPAAEVVAGWERSAEQLGGAVSVEPVDPGLARAGVEQYLPGTEALSGHPGGQQYLDNWALVVSRFGMLPDATGENPEPEMPEAARDGVVKAFLGSRQARRVALEMASSVDSGTAVLERGARLAVDYAVRANSGDPMRWSPAAAKQMLLEWAPRQHGIPPELVSWLPEVLDAFAVYAAETRGLSDDAVMALRQAIASVSERYTNQMMGVRDGDSMDEIFQRMLEAGVDPDDEEAARQWLQTYLENRQ